MRMRTFHLKGHVSITVRKSDVDCVVVTSSGNTRLQTYECKDEEEMEKTYITIRDILLDVKALLDTPG